MRLMAAFVLMLALVLPGAAAAQRSIAPPGNSGVDEYRETVPQADGNHPSDGPDGAGRGGDGGQSLGDGGQSLSGAQLRLLRAQGRDGAAAAAVAEATGPADGRGGPDKGAAGAAKDLPTGAGEQSYGASGSLWDALVTPFTGSDPSGMGPVLPLVLVLAALASVSALVVRRRKRSA